MPANNTDLVRRLWDAADELRANSKLESSEYSVPVLKLVFLKFADNKFAVVQKEFESHQTSTRRRRRGISKTEYLARCVYPPSVTKSRYLSHDRSRRVADIRGLLCQRLPGNGTDPAVRELMIQSLTPEATEITLGANEERKQRDEREPTLRRSRVERARYVTDLAEQQLVLANPENRLVAAPLEKLRYVAADRESVHLKQDNDVTVARGVREDISRVCQDFPALSAASPSKVQPQNLSRRLPPGDSSSSCRTAADSDACLSTDVDPGLHFSSPARRQGPECFGPVS